MLPIKTLGLAISALVPLVSTLSTDLETGAQQELDLSILIKHVSPHFPMDVRLPPTFNSSTHHDWTPTPGNWFLGTWYFTYSNEPNYKLWQNMQWTLSARPNNSFDNTLNDLTSFQFLNNTKVWSIYGIDSPIPNPSSANSLFRDAYDYHPTGPLSFAYNSWEVIAWGYDSVGVPYAVVYETPAFETPAAFDIISRHDKGPAKDTVAAIYHAVAKLDNQELNALVKNVTQLVQNGGRNGAPFPTCDATCMTNTVNPYGL